MFITGLRKLDNFEIGIVTCKVFCCISLKIFKAVTKWLAYDWENRQQHAERLLRKVRLGTVPELSLAEGFTDDLLAVPELKQLFVEVVKDQYQIYDGIKPEHKELFKLRGVTVS